MHGSMLYARLHSMLDGCMVVELQATVALRSYMALVVYNLAWHACGMLVCLSGWSLAGLVG